MWRFIPAGAGNGGRYIRCLIHRPVHPRGCGERPGCSDLRFCDYGSSPRVRGTAGAAVATGAGYRFIPAGAGNGHEQEALLREYAVHPRGCGERLQRFSGSIYQRGSSPRVRGTAGRGDIHHPPRRFIPAGAGNGYFTNPINELLAVHPRGCGERLASPLRRGTPIGSSPRVRGTAPPTEWLSSLHRFIPAGAGNGPG